ncbi:MAG TPA: hypothetical protein VJ783_28515 [Pirellulales bacterium]|nr:hypothetical protein [Pirellulales bacterium]
MQQPQAVLAIGPLAVVGVVLVIGLLVAVFSSRSWLGALAAIFGLLLLAVVLGGSLLIFRVARSGVSVPEMPPPPPPPQYPAPQVKKSEAVGRAPAEYKTETIGDSKPLLDQATSGDGKPLRAEAEETIVGTTTTLPQSTAAPLVSNEMAEVHGGLPEWVTRGEGRVDGVFRMPIAIGPFPSYEDCGPEKPKAYADAIKRYANEYLEEGAGKYVNLPMWYINQNIYRTEAKEYRESPTLGRMVVAHYLLEFNDDVRQHIAQVYHQALVAERLKYGGLGAAGVFGLLATAFGYLKLDTLSRGYYTGRLRAAAAIAILGLAVGLFFVA